MPRSLTSLVPVRFLEGRRWNAADAREVLARVAASGLSLREFAGRHGLDPQRLYRWRAELGSVPSVAAPVFVEIKARASTAIEVVLRTGHVVRVQDGFGEEVLRRVVAVLGGSDASC